MAVWGEASYLVKRAIAFRERFTVAELADTTGLSYSQVEQVVQRLVDSGYVHASENAEPGAAAKKQVGRPRTQYTLTEDSARREKFRADVAAISAIERRSLAKDRRPSTAHYSRAMQTIEAAEQGMPFTAADLDQAEGFIRYGRDFEGLIPEGADIVEAYYDVAAFRLEALRGDYAKAEGFLARAKEAFQAAGLQEETERITDLTLGLTVEAGLTEITSRIDSTLDSQKSVQGLVRSLSGWSSRNYLVVPLQRALMLCGYLLEARRNLQRLQQQQAIISQLAEDSVLQQQQAIISQLAEDSEENLAAALSLFLGIRPLKEAARETDLNLNRITSRATVREDNARIVVAVGDDQAKGRQPDRSFEPGFRLTLPTGEAYGSGRAVS